MKNFEKYTSTESRSKAFFDYCGERDCKTCPLKSFKDDDYAGQAVCAMAFLDLEAEPETEEPLPCPFCGRRVAKSRPDSSGQIQLACQIPGCGYRTAYGLPYDAVAAHNNVARAVLAAKARKEDAK